MAAKKTKETGIVGKYVIARCTQAGVHAGIVATDDGKHIVLKDSRRIHYWTGAASLSEIAVYGLNPSKSGQSRIAAKVGTLRLREADVCELIVCQPEGRKCIEEFKEWRA